MNKRFSVLSYTSESKAESWGAHGYKEVLSQRRVMWWW